MPRIDGQYLMRGAYRVASWGLLPAAFGYFWWRGRREPDYRRGWRQRLGHAGALPAGATWIHAASVGEVLLAEPLVRELHRRAPQRPVVVTTFTPTGAAQVRERLSDVAVHRYLPLDTVGATRRFMRQLQPCCGILVETELWPHLLAAAARAEVPLVIANASISARSAARYAQPWLSALMRPALQRLTAVGAASEEHAQRFAALGVPRERIRVTGNLKHDTEPDADLPTRAADLRQAWQARQRPLWVAASTHEGEERIVLEARRRLCATGCNALLVLAPRHPQRFDAVRELLAAQDLRVAARSRNEPVDADTAVVLGDTLGEVPLFYAAADAAFVGGSLVPGIGGHNVLEAAALACPVLTGPHTGEWRDGIESLTAAGGLRTVADAPALADGLRTWLADDGAGRRAGQAARDCQQAQRGALVRLLQLLDDTVGF